MKSYHRIIVLLVVLATLIALSASVFAANTADTAFNDFFYEGDNNNYLPPREKTNTTPHYLYITSGTDATVRVKSLGSTNEDFANANNVFNATYSNGGIVAYVISRVGTKYSVHNLVYESLSSYNNKYASIAILGLYSKDNAGYVTGVWSPDSSGTYVSARQ